MSTPDPAGTALDLRKLRQFITAVEAPTLRIAAAELFVTQQGLSAALRQLEIDVGIRLFDRRGRTLQLTEAGRELYKHAPAALAAGRSALEAARQIEAGSCGPFTIGRSPAISAEEAYDLIKQVARDNPDQKFTVQQVNPHEMRDALLAGTIDLALRRGVADAPELTAEVLGYHTLRAAVAAHHPLATNEVIEASALVQYPVVVCATSAESTLTDFLLSYCRGHGFNPTTIPWPVEGVPLYTAVDAYEGAWAFVTDRAGAAYGGTVKVLDFVPPPKVPMQGLWIRHAMSPVRDRILDAARARIPPGTVC